MTGAQWTIDAYNVTFAAFLLTAGSLGDRFSRRRMLRIGLVARAVQGLGAAMMLAQGLAIAALSARFGIDWAG
ncbi:hypothetical protein [Mycobacterium sp. DL99]|uniref:hypothetical protein n=1 Tax=Mycobacterium sp. DL99 TaxID=2528957 RepID=UPI0025712E26|nr:hypothetical protein [Mycobacterium sp. DL99]